MILRPVRPVSPCGPPTTKLPVGLIRYSVSLVSIDLGSTALTIFSMQNFSISACSAPAACWVEMTTFVMRVGLPSTYSTETCDFASGAQPLRGFAGLADLGELPAEAMREHDRCRHQLRRLVGRIAEHDALVARALLGGFLALGLLGVHPLCDVGRLRGEDVLHENLVGVKHVVVVHVTDLADGIAGDLHVVEFRLGGDLAADDGDIALHVGLAGDAALRVLREAGVEHGVGNRVGDLVGVAFADGFRGKDVATGHARKEWVMDRDWGDRPKQRIDQS